MRARARADADEDLGVAVEPLTPQLANRLEVPRDIDGVVVTDIDPDGRAADAGLREGDVIRQVDGKPFTRRPSCDRRSAPGQPPLADARSARGATFFATIAVEG